MEFRPALKEELPAVLSLYRSVMGTPFCTWNEYYPTRDEIDTDYAHGSLYLLIEGSEILGAISLLSAEPELEALDCWICREYTAELSRVVVSPSMQGRGLSRLLVQKAEDILRSRGCAAVHLLAAVCNTPAKRCYASCGYVFHTQVEMYDNLYYACEKLL